MRRLAAVVVISLTVTSLAACDAASKVTGPDPDDAAEGLATALSSGAFADVAFTDTTPQDVTADYQQVVEGMGELEPTVEAGDVQESDGSATTTLTWTWPVGAGDDGQWTYTTEAGLTEADDAWQVAWSRRVIEPKLADDSVLDVTPIAGPRGPILGAHGVALVTARPVVRFGIDKTQVGSARAADSARALAQLVGIDAASYAKQVEAAGDEAFVEAIVLRKDDVPVDVARDYGRIKGARAIPDDVPLAPTREFAAPILGTVGPVTAEMVKDDPDKYAVGDVAGLSGLQARYDDQLQGVDGVVVNEVKADGSERELYRLDAKQGTPLRLTMDERLQTAAEQALANVGPASALVAIRPSTGAILAAANGPGTDGYNAATYGQYAPGSTFKTVSSLALLRAGLTPDTVVPCTTAIVVDGKRFENYDDYPSSALGDVPLRTAIANSCNTAVISQRGKVHQGDLAGAAASLGLGIDHDLGFPAYFGQVPDPTSDTEAAADLIGQGGILASPMAMATVVASIQAGHTVVPQLVKSVDSAVPDEAEPLTGSETAALRGLLRGVVTSGSGTGLLDVPGPPVIAKTGTAEFEQGGKTLTHAWMVAAQGDLAVAVLVDVGSSGSGTAGPIIEQFLRAA
ncbi:penicillin-binding transpeptidase domain-containing protein [Nocardioides mangrovi]|uniref:Penicillin-binding protein n=1 Tax=Nocardioides mangrovi TaxID=2874580 RepID=A0ABS7UAS4_9ACTN|nr:penicillin-binding transpeptidase domain-containing protein [Nocardioides mangrovi]MBZ5738086.1 penicillin-binding protein [Nocardioides mangrovi]